MLNPYALLAAIAVAVGLFGGGLTVGMRWEAGKQAIENQHIAEAVDAANASNAEAIASLTPKYTTIQGKVRHEIETHTVYADCKLTPTGVQLANQALTNGPKPSDGGKLPPADEATK